MVDNNESDGSGSRGWRLTDPRPIQAEVPYTFFVPSDVEKAALCVGDIVKLEFEEYDAEGSSFERMWVVLEAQTITGWIGRLDNEPDGFDGLLVLGYSIPFENDHIYSVWQLKIDQTNDEVRMRARCYVDPSVVDGSGKIGRIERRSPRNWLRPFARYPFTGWYIYTDTEAKLPRAQMMYVAIGVVLNKDDSILPYLGNPIGTRLVRHGDDFQPI